MNRAEAYVRRDIHPNNSECDFRTPAYLWRWINDRFGEIEYDGACEAGVNNLATPLRLEDSWPIGATVYSNPPFDSDSIVKWFEKGEELAANGGVHIMCLPNKISQVFFQPLIARFDEIIFLGGRVNFESPHAVKGGASMSGTMITRQGGKRVKNSPIIEGILLKDIKKEWRE